MQVTAPAHVMNRLGTSAKAVLRQLRFPGHASQFQQLGLLRASALRNTHKLRVTADVGRDLLRLLDILQKQVVAGVVRCGWNVQQKHLLLFVLDAGVIHGHA